MLVLDNELMQIVPKEVSANSTTVAIVDSEKRAFWPVLRFKILWFRFHDVENDSNSILIIVPYNTLIGICSIPRDQSVSLVRKFGVLVVGKCLKFLGFTERNLISNLLKVEISSAENLISLSYCLNWAFRCCSSFYSFLDRGCFLLWHWILARSPLNWWVIARGPLRSVLFGREELLLELLLLVQRRGRLPGGVWVHFSCGWVHYLIVQQWSFLFVSGAAKGFVVGNYLFFLSVARWNTLSRMNSLTWGHSLWKLLRRKNLSWWLNNISRDLTWTSLMKVWVLIGILSLLVMKIWRLVLVEILTCSIELLCWSHALLRLSYGNFSLRRNNGCSLLRNLLSHRGMSVDSTSWSSWWWIIIDVIILSISTWPGSVTGRWPILCSLRPLVQHNLPCSFWAHAPSMQTSPLHHLSLSLAHCSDLTLVIRGHSGLWLTLSLIRVIGRRVGSLVWSFIWLRPLLLSWHALHPIVVQIQCLVKELLLAVYWYLMHAICRFRLLKISVNRNAIIVLIIRNSSHQLANVLIKLGGWGYILVAGVNAAQLVGECNHLLILTCLLLYLKRFSSLFSVVQIIWVGSLAIFLSIHVVDSCFIHASKIGDLCVVLSTVLHVLVAASLIEKGCLRINIRLVLMHWLRPWVTRLRRLVLGCLSTTTWHPILLLVPSSSTGIVVATKVLWHINLHYVSDIPLGLTIPVLHGVHESFNILLICCILRKQLEFIVYHILMGILLIWIISIVLMWQFIWRWVFF